jgi:hypothetical protein
VVITIERLIAENVFRDTDGNLIRVPDNVGTKILEKMNSSGRGDTS